MIFRRYASILLITFAVSYAPIFAAWYCGMFLNDWNFTTFRLDSFLTEKTSQYSKYIVDPENLHVAKNREAISLGILRPKAQISCGSSTDTLVPLDKLESANSGNTPVSINFEQNPECQRLIEVKIISNAVIGPGHSGLVVIGSTRLIGAVVNFVTLFADRLRIILTFVVFLVFFVRTRNKILGVSEDLKTGLELNLFAWIVFLGISSGIIPTILPFQVDQSIYHKILYTVSAICHLGPVVYYFLQFNKDKKLYFLFLAAIVIPIVTLPNGGHIYSYLGLGVTAIGIGKIAWEKMKNWPLFFYAISLLINFTKIGFAPSNITEYLPHWHFSSVFIGIYLLFETTDSIRKNAIVFSAIRFVYEGIRVDKDHGNFIVDLQSVCKVLGCSRVSLLKINQDNTCSIYSLDKNKNDKDIEIVNLTTFPPVFSHSITAQREMFHVEEDSYLARQLREKIGKMPLGYKVFSVIPFRGRIGDLGALAVTGYEIEQETSMRDGPFENAFRIIAGYFQKRLELESNIDRVNASKDVDASILMLNDIDNISDRQNLEKAISTFCKILGFKGFLAYVNKSEKRLEIQAYLSLNEKEKMIATKMPLKVDGKNELGPVPLAANSGRPAFVNDMNLVKGLLSQLSQEFLDETKCSSLAVIPFDFILPSAMERMRGVFYLSSESKNVFDDYMQTAVKAYVDALRRRFEHVGLAKKNEFFESALNQSNESLGQFIPKNLIADYLKGIDVVEKDYGFLMMFDLKGSTNLANDLGGEVFRNIVDSLRVELVKVLGMHLWILQRHVWDSFEFTKSSDPESVEKIDIDNLSNLIKNVFFSWKSNVYQKYRYSSCEKISFRVCFTFGDTSRGIVKDGKTRKWDFIGNAIAVVSKIEQASKTLDGFVFVDSSIVMRSAMEWTAMTETKQGLIIYSLKNSADQSLKKKVA